MKKFVLFVVFFLCLKISSAQVIDTGKSVVVKPVFGSHVFYDQGHLLQDKLYGLDVSFFKEISSNQDKWIRRSGAKSYGIGLTMRDFSDLKGALDTAEKAFGQAFGVVSQMEFQLFRIGSTKFRFTPGVGLSYLTKHYFSDVSNRLIGSHINMTIKADLALEIPITENTDITTGLGFTHYSNAGYNIPNGGLNTGNIFVGMRFNGAKSAGGGKSSFERLEKNSFELSAGIGRRGVYQAHRGYYKSGLFAGYNYRLNELMSLKGGVDATYYYTTLDRDNFNETFQNYGSSYDKWRYGISAGMDVNIWRLAINGQIGYYLHYNTFYPETTWYWTFGPTYFVNKHIGLQAKTYMHFAQADFLNWGLVYRM